MHSNWREEDPRRILRLARERGGTITPYARYPGLRSWIVSWPDREYGASDRESAEGHLYVVRCHVRSRVQRASPRLTVRNGAASRKAA
jgi:hypothetical protein